MRPLRAGDRVVSSLRPYYPSYSGVVVEIDDRGLVHLKEDQDPSSNIHLWSVCNLRLEPNGLDVMLELL